MQRDVFLGIDIGSITVKTAVLDAGRAVLATTYIRIKGDPVSTLVGALTAFSLQFPESRIGSAGITG